MMTVEQLRTFEGFESITDEEAQEIIANYCIISELLFELYQNEIDK